MVSHRLSSIGCQIKSYKTLYRRWFHIGCQVYRYNLIRLYTEHGFNRLSSIQIQSYNTLYRRWFHKGCQVYR